MIETNYELTELYKFYVYTTDGECSMHRAYDYDFEDGWLKIHGLEESAYFRESTIKFVRMVDIND